MEKIKKTILQAVTTIPTNIGHEIIPDLTAVYHLKIGLKQESQDIGFFDAFITGGTTPPPTTC